MFNLFLSLIFLPCIIATRINSTKINNSTKIRFKKLADLYNLYPATIPTNTIANLLHPI